MKKVYIYRLWRKLSLDFLRNSVIGNADCIEAWEKSKIFKGMRKMTTEIANKK